MNHLSCVVKLNEALSMDNKIPAKNKADKPSQYREMARKHP